MTSPLNEYLQSLPVELAERIRMLGSKSGRRVRGETWVIHSEAEWTDKHLHDASNKVETFLISEFWKAIGLAPIKASYAATHRWMYAIPSQPLPENCLFDKEQKIGACGGWCGGPRVEGAFLSGTAIAERVLGLYSSSAAATAQGDLQLPLF